jgi:DNA-binding NtrC family response regulator
MEVTASGLSELGYQVRKASNAEEALRLIDEGEAIDVLFSDVIMPGGMNGVQLAVEARRRRPGLKVLLTSGYTPAALADEHGLSDDLDLLGKPFRADEVERRLRLVIDQ